MSKSEQKRTCVQKECFYRSELESKIATMQPIVDAAVRAVDGDYGVHSKLDKCRHGLYGYEQCEECVLTEITPAVREYQKGAK